MSPNEESVLLTTSESQTNHGSGHLGAGRALLGVGLTLALVAGGLWASGTSARALSYVRQGAAQLPGLNPMQGSSAARKQIEVDGRTLAVLDCTTTRGPKSVLDHYEAQARGQMRRGAPYLRQDPNNLGIGTLVWQTPEGVSKAVLVQRDTERKRGTRYRLLVDESKQPLVAAQVGRNAGAERALAGGLVSSALVGCKVVHSVRAPDGTGVTLLEARGDARAVAARLLSQLEAQGFSTDDVAYRAYQGEGDLTLPLSHATQPLRGLLKVTPSGSNSRVVLSVNPSL